MTLRMSATIFCRSSGSEAIYSSGVVGFVVIADFISRISPMWIKLWAREIHIPVPFPRRAFVGGKRLTPNGRLRVGSVPVEFHDNIFAIENVARKKFADLSVERADLTDL